MFSPGEGYSSFPTGDDVISQSQQDESVNQDPAAGARMDQIWKPNRTDRPLKLKWSLCFESNKAVRIPW